MVVIEGLDEYMKSMMEEPNLSVVDQTLDEASDIGVTESKRVVRVRTGYLKSTIEKISGGKLKKGWIAGAYYSGFVEFGTKYMGPFPFMRPGAQKVVQWLQRMLPKKLDESMKKKGMALG